MLDALFVAGVVDVAVVLLVGTVLVGTVLVGTVLVGTVLVGTVLVGTVGAVLPVDAELVTVTVEVAGNSVDAPDAVAGEDSPTAASSPVTIVDTCHDVEPPRVEEVLLLGAPIVGSVPAAGAEWSARSRMPVCTTKPTSTPTVTLSITAATARPTPRVIGPPSGRLCLPGG